MSIISIVMMSLIAPPPIVDGVFYQRHHQLVKELVFVCCFVVGVFPWIRIIPSSLV